MDTSHDDFRYHGTESPLPPAVNHWVPLFLPLLALMMGLMFFGIIYATQL